MIGVLSGVILLVSNFFFLLLEVSFVHFYTAARQGFIAFISRTEESVYEVRSHM